jgi:hypothetical protein
MADEAEEWYYVDTEGNQEGPVSSDELKQAYSSGSTNDECLVWNENMDEWTAIEDLADLKAFLNPPKPKPKARAAPSRPSPGAPPAKTKAPSRGGGKGKSKLTSALEKANSEAMQHGGWKEMKTADGGEYYFNILTEDVTWDKPKELETPDEAARDGDWYWLSDPVEAYVPGRKVNSTGGKVQFEKENGGYVSLPAAEAKALEPLNWSNLRTKTNDLVLLDVMNPPLIMYNLAKRFAENEIYTNVGTILISCNPYKRLPLYTPTVIDSYIKKGSRKMPPHVYNIADDAFRDLREWNRAQSIVISGESGAGKTECTKQALQYLAEIAGSAANNVEQKILSSNPILEAFGNAKTTRNNNSSRFGKYVEVLFNVRSQICGASIKNYLLEKIRVCNQNQGERNYHIFYQLCAGLDQKSKSAYSLTDPSQFHYTNQSGDYSVDDMDDEAEFNDMVQAMETLGFTASEKEKVLKTTAAILHIGNIEFKNTGDRKCEIKRNTQSTAANLLQVDNKAFGKVVTTRFVRVRGQKAIESGMSAEEAAATRDALAKFIYGKMFDWLVDKIRKSIGEGDKQRGRSIGILDIFGFEIFTKNQFEQMCINFANEKLQQFFNSHTFKKEEEVYRTEQIAFDHVEYIDNQPVLDLIEKKPRGILLMIDEEIKVPKGSDSTFVQKLNRTHMKTAEFKCIRKRPQNFAIRHYAGVVEYESAGFLEKNRDKLSPDQYNLLSDSKFDFLRLLFPAGGEEGDKRTLGTKFALQLNNLMKALNATEPHYIRCIKPNPNKAPMEFEGMMSMLQLRYSGVFEAVKIRKQGFPFRLTHREFWLRYKCIMPRSHNWSRDMIANARFLINEMKQDPEQVQIGKTMVLYRAKQHRDMDLRRNLAVEQVAIFIQKYARRNLAKLLEIRCKMIRPVIAKAIASRSIEQVSAALKRAAGVGFDTAEILEAKRMLFVFEEEQRLEGVFAVLCTQDPHQFFDQYAEAVASADDIDLHSPSAEHARELHEGAIADRERIDADAEEQLKILDEDVMAEIIVAAADIHYVSDVVNELRVMLYEYAEDKFVKLQLQAAVALRDDTRITKKTIRLKELFFQKQGQMFLFDKYNKLYSRETWSNLKFFNFHADQLAMSMLKHTTNSIHAPLSQLSEKPVTKAATKMFRNIQGYMGDRKLQFPEVLCCDLLRACLEMRELRDEVYCQIIKQLNDNPSPQSVTKGWNLMLICLHTFPPNGPFENFLEMYIRSNAPEPQMKYVYKLHTTLYGGAKRVAPEPAELPGILAYEPPVDEKKAPPPAAAPAARPAAPGRPAAPPPGKPARARPDIDETVEWYYLDADGEQQGPACASEVKEGYQAGNVDSTALVWNENMEGWEQLDTQPDLYAFCQD